MLCLQTLNSYKFLNLIKSIKYEWLDYVLHSLMWFCTDTSIHAFERGRGCFMNGRIPQTREYLTSASIILVFCIFTEHEYILKYIYFWDSCEVVLILNSRARSWRLVLTQFDKNANEKELWICVMKSWL